MTRGETGRLARVLVGVALAASAVVLFWLAVQARERARQLDRLQQDVREARGTALDCQAELGRREDAFRRLDARVDSMRLAVRSYEEDDAQGVPRVQREDYDEYLEGVERYNRSVEAWERRAEMLRESEASCRAAVERHNLLADSLRRWLSGDAGEPSE